MLLAALLCEWWRASTTGDSTLSSTTAARCTALALKRREGRMGRILHTGEAWLQEGMPVPEDESVLTRSARAPDRVIAYGADPAQNMEIRSGGAGAGQRPLIVMIHGGFWRP